MPDPSYTAALLLNPASVNFLTLDHATYGQLDTGMLLGDFSEGEWTDVQTRLMAFTATHGRDDERSGVVAGTLSLDLDDDDGALDPENASSAYFPYVQLNKRARAQATWAAVTYTLGYTFADAYEPTRKGAVGATVTVRATDLFKRLARRSLRSTYPPQSTNERIGAVLDALNWPVERRSLAVGHLQLPGVTLNGTGALEHLDQVVRAERGAFFIRGDGTAVFQGRYDRQVVASRGTFGAGTTLPVTLVEGAYTEDGMANEVSIRLLDGTAYTVSDATSQAQHGEVPSSIADDTAALLGEDEARRAFADATLAAQKQPISRIRTVALDANASPTLLWPHVLGAEVGDRITLTHNVAGTKGLTATDFFIERVSHAVSFPGPMHTCTWSVSKAPALAYFRLDNATFGKLDSGVLGF